MDNDGNPLASEVMTSTTYSEAAWSAVVHSGLGPVSPNTVLLGWMADWRKRTVGVGEGGAEDSNSDVSNANVCNASDFVVMIKSSPAGRRGAHA